MLKIDEELLQKTKGQIGEPLEQAIQSLNRNRNEFDSTVFGAVLPVKSFLVNKETAKNLIISTAQHYWGNVDLSTHQFFRMANNTIELVNERLQSFFSSSQGKQAIFDYMLIHNSFNFENLINIIFGKNINVSMPVGGLNCFYLYQVGKKFFVHTIYSEKSNFWSQLFLKKVNSIFLQEKLEAIQTPVGLMKQFFIQLQTLTTHSQAVSITNELINKIDFLNRRSFQLKEIHFFNVIIHFNGGKRHYHKLKRLIPNVLQTWGQGSWALTEKEQTLLTYILALDNAKSNNFIQTIRYGKYLIDQDRLNNHAIEIILEYSDALPILKPEPATLVKRYDKNYLEQIFFILIDALVQNNQFDDVIQLLKDYEIASCTSIYELFNVEPFHEDLLHRLEATVQRDIAYIVDDSPQHVLLSIDSWLQHYKQTDSTYYEIADMTSKHVCNILKALFATKHYDYFEKLMEVYNKYLKLDNHFDNLKQFVATVVKN